MPTPYIVVFSAASIQRYIFQSNRLKENIGASYLAQYWLEKGLVTAIQQTSISLNTTIWEAYRQNPSISQAKAPVDTTAEANLIYIGGGNAALLCDNRDIANRVVETWSRELLQKAPGLRVAVGYGEVDGSLAEAYCAALDDLNRCEEALSFGSTLHGLPVVRSCPTTGLPASVLSREENEEKVWVSQAAAIKRAQVGSKVEPGNAQKAITEEFKSVPNERQRFAIELDDLGSYEGESHIAVVHADGNGMGELLNSVIDQDGPRDDEFLHDLRAFSASVSSLSQRALKKTLQHLQDALPLKELQHSQNIFPLRPIVYGGDDLTFVCDGRVGLDLAAFYLEQFSNGTIKVCGEDKSVDACAGVAIVPMKFPFAHAYSFADELCSLAKAHRRDGNLSGSWLDFQIIQEGVTGSVTTLRKSQYRSLEEETLHQRPYQVPDEWQIFVKILQDVQITAMGTQPCQRAATGTHAGIYRNTTFRRRGAMA